MRLACSYAACQHENCGIHSIRGDQYSWFIKMFAGSLGCHVRGSSITLVCYVLYGRWEDFVISSWVREFIGKGNHRNPRTLITCQHKHLSHVDLLIMFYRTRSMCDIDVSKYIILYISVFSHSKIRFSTKIGNVHAKITAMLHDDRIYLCRRQTFTDFPWREFV